jgi:hypothetical protein
MSNKIQTADLVIGKGYYLDGSKKTRGVFKGVDKSSNALVFADVKDNTVYLLEGDNLVRFPNENQPWWEYEN